MYIVVIIHTKGYGRYLCVGIDVTIHTAKRCGGGGRYVFVMCTAS